MRLTRVEYMTLHRQDNVKIVHTHNPCTGDLTYRNEPGVHLYKELEKLSRYEDICDEPEKLLLYCNMELLKAMKGGE